MQLQAVATTSCIRVRSIDARARLPEVNQQFRVRRYGSMGARKARVSVESSICIYGLMFTSGLLLVLNTTSMPGRCFAIYLVSACIGSLVVLDSDMCVVMLSDPRSISRNKLLFSVGTATLHGK
jgi:hypothetical protein